MSCSTSFTWQLVRGALAVVAIAAAVALQSHPAALLVAVVAAMALLGGCPACWVSRLVETWQQGRKDAAAQQGESPGPRS